MSGTHRMGAVRTERAIFGVGVAAFAIAFIIGGLVALVEWDRLPYGSLNYLRIVQGLRLAGNSEAAIRELEAAQRINVTEPRAGVALAALLSGAGKPGALATLERASVNSFSPEVHLKYARKASQLGRFDEADIGIRRATSYASDSVIVWIAVAGIREQSLQRDEARAAYQKALELDPSSIPAREGLRRLGSVGSAATELTR